MAKKEFERRKEERTRVDPKQQLTISRAKQFDRCICRVIFSGKVIPVNFRKSVFVEILCVACAYSYNIQEKFSIMEIVFIRFG